MLHFFSWVTSGGIGWKSQSDTKICDFTDHWHYPEFIWPNINPASWHIDPYISSKRFILCTYERGSVHTCTYELMYFVNGGLLEHVPAHRVTRGNTSWTSTCILQDAHTQQFRACNRPKHACFCGRKLEYHAGTRRTCTKESWIWNKDLLLLRRER